jgi:lysophospholipase L1-like esterase
MAAGLCAVVATSYVVSPLHPLRPWVLGGDYVPFWNVVGREWLGEGELLEAEAANVAKLQRQTQAPKAKASAPTRVPNEPVAAKPVFPPYSSVDDLERPKHAIEPPEALDPYFLKLTLADLAVEGAIARAGHWGDSVLGVDGITSAIRRRMQSRFGDAGHGFHLMDRYNPSYRQQGIEFEPGGGWNRCLVVFECRKRDRRYGYGGLVVDSAGGGAAVWRTTKEGFGKTVSVFELWFSHQEQGGKLEINIDAKEKVSVDTRGAHLEDGWHKVHVEPGPHSFTVRAVGGGNVRAYGVVLENNGPGVVWDGMALIGGSTRGLRTQHPEHIARQIRHRKLDLMVFMFGGNDMERKYVDLKGSMQPYYEEYGDVLKHFRAGRPGAACLIMSLTDHGVRTPDDRIVSRPFTKELVDAQREIARHNGCAFFNTYEATGGEGTAARWHRAGLIAPDLGHPTGAGHEVIGGLLVNAILHGYEEYRARMEGEPLPDGAGVRYATPSMSGDFVSTTARQTRTVR